MPGCVNVILFSILRFILAACSVPSFWIDLPSRPCSFTLDAQLRTFFDSGSNPSPSSCCVVSFHELDHQHPFVSDPVCLEEFFVMMMMIAFIIMSSGLVPLIEGLCDQI